MSDDTQWVKRKNAAEYLDVSEDSIGRWMIPLEKHPEPVPGKLRYGILLATGEKRIVRGDLDLMIARRVKFAA